MRLRPQCRLVLPALVLALGLPACSTGSVDTGDGIRTVVVASAPTYPALPLYMGKEIFAEHGIAIDFVDMSGGGTIVSAVASGSADIADNMTPPLLGRAVHEGQDLAWFCGQSARFFADILVPPDSDVPTIEDAGSSDTVLRALRGKTVGVIALGGSADLVFRGALAEAGVDANDVTIVASGVGQAAVTSLESGQVDALYGYPFITQRLVAEGKAKLAVALDESSPMVGSLYSSGLVAQRSWIEQNGQLAASFCTAYQESVDALADPANEDRLRSQLAERFQITGDSAFQAAKNVLEGTLSTEIPREKLDATFTELGRLGVLPSEADLSYDTTVLLPNPSGTES